MTVRAGIVLAGGFARRFGDGDKTMATLGGEPLIARAVAGLESTVDRVVISCRDQQRPTFEVILPDDAAFCPDPTPDQGPLAGLSACLASVDAQVVAVATADMPLVQPGLYTELFDALDDGDGVVISDDGMRQPAPAVYRAGQLREAVAAERSTGGRRFRAVVERLDCETIAGSTVRDRWGEHALADVNTRSDLERLEREVS